MFCVISWNVNGIRAVEKKGFAQWLSECNADVVCIQETKAHPGQLSPLLLNAAGYKSYFSSAKKPGYSGVAIYSKTEPDKVFTLGDSRFDDEGRVLCACYKDLVVISAYFPNSQEAGKRLDYKLAFDDAILEFCQKLVAEGKNVLLCGDYNVAHKPIDLKNPTSNEQNPGYLPEERSWMDKFTTSGFCDTFREFCKLPDQYTWWSYRFHAREKNIGWRIDYQCVNQALLKNVKSSTILSNVQGSDHCPIKIEFDF